MHPELTIKRFPCEKYVKIKYQGKWRPYHNYLWEQANGPIPKGSVVHHKDGDKAHNALENLECLTRGEHCKLHTKGRHLSAEHKAKMSQSHMGKQASDEARAKISAALMGHEVTDEARAKMSQSHMGHEVTDETKARIKAAQVARRAREQEALTKKNL